MDEGVLLVASTQPTALEGKREIIPMGCVRGGSELCLATNGIEADPQMLTRTKWYVVPLFWGPITIFMFALSILQFTDQYVQPITDKWVC